ncbi:hypothetical protein BV20DRAFT_974750 [Pilatotrama ljubarskyi]|nr:hypothetical protein BV20DRAFT_974750 [Pilatotrama ljubarskyi]
MSATAVIGLYQALYTLNYIIVDTTALVFYDVLICLHAEIRLVWRNPRSLGSILYVVNRYPILVDCVLVVVTMSPMSDNSCNVIGWLLNILQALRLLGPALFAALRIYALSGRNKLLTGTILLLSLAPFLATVSVTYNFPLANNPPPINCSSSGSYSKQVNIGRVLATRLPVILADCIIIGITWRESYKNLGLIRTTSDDSGQPSLHRVFLQNGMLYFCVLLSLNKLDVIIELLQLTLPDALGQGDYVTQYIDPINSILTSRFILDLRAVDEKLSTQGSSAGTSSLQFAGADILSGRSHAVLSFVTESRDAANDDDTNISQVVVMVEMEELQERVS